MVVGAIGVAKEKNVLWFGTQASQTSLAPEIVVANQIYDWEVVLREILSLMSEGTWAARPSSSTLENKGLYMEFNPAFDLPADSQGQGG
jgi:basic membrane lipoprotein Med (substrate-binding protein (PBP1-ABC) superfamily)